MATSIRFAARPALLAAVVGASLLFAGCGGAAATAATASASPAAASAPAPVASPGALASVPSPAASAASSARSSGDRYGSGAGAAPSPAGAAWGNAVTVVDFGFNPTAIKVKVGTTVTWTNKGVTHTVTSDQALFDSGTFGTGDSYTFTFAKAGTFAYHCKIHSSMRGAVTVTQ